MTRFSGCVLLAAAPLAVHAFTAPSKVRQIGGATGFGGGLRMGATVEAAPADVAAPDPAAAPEAGDEWKAFDWQKHWYPMAFAKTTDRTKPSRVELMGEPLVLWYDPVASEWRAMLDACPHRLAPLSEGRVDERGQVECPYHGWTFEGDTGACTKVPQAPNPTSDVALLAKCSGVPYACAEVQGVVWVWGQPGALKALLDVSAVPTCAALDDPNFVWIDVSRDMPYSADMLLENVLDSSHVPFTHHQTISKRENAVPLPLALTERLSPRGFAGRFQRTPLRQEAPRPLTAPAAAAGSEAAAPEANEPPAAAASADADAGADPAGFQGRVTERTTVFTAPTYMHHRIQTAGADGTLATGFETWTVAYATPTGPGRSRLLARFPFRFPPPAKKWMPNVPKLVFSRLPDWLNHMGQLKVLDDDNVFLPMQERRVQDAGGWRGRYVMPTSADAYVNAYRRWFDGVGPPPHAKHAADESRRLLSGSAVDKRALLDRQAQHTDHCTSCQGALANAQLAHKVCGVALLACLAWAPAALAPAAAPFAALLLHAPFGSGMGALSGSSVGSALVALARALKPPLALALAAALLLKARSWAAHVAQSLTSGLFEYPPPRNRPARAAGNSKNLKTVEQGRKY